MKNIIYSLVFILISPVVSYSAPDEAAKFLMNDSVSMMDWGLKELEGNIRSFVAFTSETGKPPSVDVYYDWDKNRIIIQLLSSEITDPPQDTITSMKEWINIAFIQLKAHFMIDAQGKPYRATGISFLENHFVHNGYKSPKRPKNLGKKLDNITELQVLIVLAEKYNPSVLECHSPLLNDQIYCNEPVKKEAAK